MPFMTPSLAAEDESPKASSWRTWFSICIGILLALLCIVYIAFNYLATPPATFPTDREFHVPEGMSARAVSHALATEGFVRSEVFFYLTLLLTSDPTAIKASTYRFTELLTPRELAEELTTGHFGHSLVRLTLIEGERASMIADRAAEVLRDFDRASFLALAEPDEGRLFPDTYFVPSDYTAEELHSLLTTTFTERTTPLSSEIDSHPLSLSEILTLASIIEREANTAESMAMVSGILQNRLAIDMPLQADASIEYVLDKPLSQLTPNDLQMDSPYNTYTNLGLPPTPIGNPGLAAITAVLRPTESPYFYYISAPDGTFHYARTYDEHRINIATYLR